MPDSTQPGGVEFRGKARSVSFQALCPDMTLCRLPSVRSPEEASRGAPRSDVRHGCKRDGEGAVVYRGGRSCQLESWEGFLEEVAFGNWLHGSGRSSGQAEGKLWQWEGG